MELETLEASGLPGFHPPMRDGVLMRRSVALTGKQPPSGVIPGAVMGDVLGQHRHKGRCEIDRALTSVLRGAHLIASNFELDLSRNGHRSAKEIDVVHLNTVALTDTQTSEGAQRHECTERGIDFREFSGQVKYEKCSFA